MNKTMKFRWFMWEGVGASSWFMWVVSSFLSYWGITHLAPNLPQWMKDIAIGFAIVINFVEFMIDQKGWYELWHPKTFGDIVLRLFGAACYAYDILTNVEGFIAIVFAAYNVTQIAQAWGIDPILTILAVLFGFCFAAGPEPVYLEYLNGKFQYPGITPWRQFWNGLTRKTVHQPAKPNLRPADTLSKPYQYPNQKKWQQPAPSPKPSNKSFSDWWDETHPHHPINRG